MAAGITQPSGAGTTIFIYDDSDTSGGRAAGPYTFAQIATAFPADFIDNGTAFRSYRSKVSIQCGDAGTGTATTTLTDSDCSVLFDTTKVLQYRTTQTTSWNTNFGTKVGSGNKATGRSGVNLSLGGATTLRGNASIYGSYIRTTGGALAFTPATSGTNYELINCIVFNAGTGSTSTISVGTNTVAVSNLYNVDFLGNISGALTGILITLNAVAAERLTIGGPSMGAFIRSAQISINVKDLALFGTPSTADMVATAANNVIPAGGWNLVDMTWSGNAAKFGNMTQQAGSIVEHRTTHLKATDYTGAGISGISLKGTDQSSAVLFNGTTGSTGDLFFGSGLTANAVPVRDHYGTAANYVTRDRFPLLIEGNVTSPNANYPQVRYDIGAMLDANGNFVDIGEDVSFGNVSGGPTPWVEMSI